MNVYSGGCTFNATTSRVTWPESILRHMERWWRASTIRCASWQLDSKRSMWHLRCCIPGKSLVFMKTPVLISFRNVITLLASHIFLVKTIVSRGLVRTWAATIWSSLVYRCGASELSCSCDVSCTITSLDWRYVVSVTSQQLLTNQSDFHCGHWSCKSHW